MNQQYPQPNIDEIDTPVFYLGLETLPGVNIVSQGVSTWRYANTYGTTTDFAVGITFKVSMTPSYFIGKRMDCSNVGCGGAKTMWVNTSDRLGTMGNGVDFCISANYAGKSRTQICNSLAT